MLLFIFNMWIKIPHCVSVPVDFTHFGSDFTHITKFSVPCYSVEISMNCHSPFNHQMLPHLSSMPSHLTCPLAPSLTISFHLLLANLSGFFMFMLNLNLASRLLSVLWLTYNLTSCLFIIAGLGLLNLFVSSFLFIKNTSLLLVKSLFLPFIMVEKPYCRNTFTVFSLIL